MEDSQLQTWVESLSHTHFGIPFLHRATFNPRLRTTGGRYHLSDHRLEMNPAYLHQHGPDVFARIILHELCHYHLHLQGKGYRHRDRDFQQLLHQVGGLRYAPTRTDQAQRKKEPYKYLLTCQSCGKEYPRKRKVNTSRYRCGVCRGKLVQESL